VPSKESKEEQVNLIKIKKFELPTLEEDYINMTSAGIISVVLLPEPRHSKGTTMEIAFSLF